MNFRFFSRVIVLLAFCFLFFVSPVLAKDPVLPNYKGFLNDFAQVIDVDSAVQITRICRSVEASTGAELAVVTVPSIDPWDIELYSVELFKKWEIGKRKIDNGILFIFAVAERKVRIEVGYGLEGVLPDAKCGEILDEYVIPSFKKGEFGQGMLMGTQAIAKRIVETYQGDGKFVDKEDESFGLIFFVILLVISAVVFLFSSSKTVSGIGAGIGAPVGWFYMGGLEGMGLGILIGTIMGTGMMSRGGGMFMGGGFGGGSGGGGGFGGFGGGRSGGGGSSRGF